MPELPDVEKHRRRFDEHAAGHTVTGVAVPDPEILAGTTPQGLGRSLTGRDFGAARRHGKWLFLTTDGQSGDQADEAGPSLVVHFRMTGELVFADDASGRDDRDAIVFELDGLEVRYRTMRRMGRVHWLAPGADHTTVTGPLGPDALTLESDELQPILEGRRGGIKSALMDQELIAGLGNELVDEILWRARLHPKSSVSDLDADDHGELDRQLRRTLRQAVRVGHVPSGPTWLNAQRGADQPRCPDGDTDLEKTTVSGRATYLCPQHQPAP